MNPIGKQIQSDSLINQADISGLPQKIAQAIKTAAARTGVDFSYLLNKASQESGFDPNAKASTSSATGLFQFTNQTWLQTIKDHGAQYGLGQYADQIKIDSNGVAHVADPAAKQAILALRNDPQISAEMAGELDKQNLSSLQQNVGGKLGATDLYLAHFLGAGGASDFLNSLRETPNAKAADVLPQAAAANPSVFYNDNGQPKSLKQIYQHFAQKFEGGSAVSVASLASTPTATTSKPAYTYADASTPHSLSSTYTASTSTYTPSVLSSVKPSTSSLFSTMVLAQMGLGDMTSHYDSAYKANSDSKKNNLASTINLLS